MAVRRHLAVPDLSRGACFTLKANVEGVSRRLLLSMMRSGSFALR
jgi:hypothetical protein